mgnify:CR=1 FL=1
MRILQRLFITVVILLGCNFAFAEAEIVVETNGRIRVVAGEYNRNGIRPWKYISGNGPMFYHEYSPHFDKSLPVRHAASGAVSKSKVPVQVLNTVSRKAVLSGAFGLVKAGARLGLKAVPYVGAASYAYDAYQVVKSTLESEGYEYSQEQGEFIKGYPDALCLKDRAVNSCVGIDSSIIKAKNKGGQSEKDAEELMRILVEKDFQKTSKIIIEDRYKGAYLQFCFFAGFGVSCQISTGTRFWYGAKNGFHSETLTEEKFLQIATQSIDGNPTPFVEGAGKPEYKENIKVPAGTVVTIGPVTPENGKPVQITITFGKDSNGNTTAEVATTQRPDLDPGSPAAPNTKPDPDPNPNPDGKPDKKPDGNPDGKPDKKPDDKPDPDGKDDPKKDKRPKEDDKPKEDGGLLCKVFPNILACDELPEKEEPNLEIPQETIDLNFTPDNTFKEYGECPAPVTFQALGTEYKISLEPACNLAAMMRPFIIAMAWLVASFFVARVVRNNA